MAAAASSRDRLSNTEHPPRGPRPPRGPLRSVAEEVPAGEPGLCVTSLPLEGAVAAQRELSELRTHPQASATSGWWSLALAVAAGAIITPLGEEAFFRGVVANALLTRYGTWVGVIVSAAIFAVAHGINPILPVAFVVGVLTALLFRWSGSIWPGVVLHGVNNATALLLPLVLASAAA